MPHASRTALVAARARRRITAGRMTCNLLRHLILHPIVLSYTDRSIMGQFDGKQFEGQQFNGQQFNVGAGGGGPTSECDGLYYANRSDVEVIYGTHNINKWADVENDGDVDLIGQRICWALQNSHAQMNDRMAGGPYLVPFIQPYPRQ